MQIKKNQNNILYYPLIRLAWIFNQTANNRNVRSRISLNRIDTGSSILWSEQRKKLRIASNET